MGLRGMTGNTEAAPVVYTSRWEERDARRKENARIAREAAANRHARVKATLVERVEKAKERLAGVNAAGAIQLIQGAPPLDYDVMLLAEMHGQARRGVLKQFGAPRGSVERQYLAEVGEAGLGSPDHTPDEGVKE